MKILALHSSEYILRDDLDEEDLICLLDLLRDVRDEYSGKLIDVSVGTKQPRSAQTEQPRHDTTWQNRPDAA